MFNFADDDVVMQEVLQLRADELRLSAMLNALRVAPRASEQASEFMERLAELDRRAAAVERLLDAMPTAISAPQQLVA